MCDFCLFVGTFTDRDRPTTREQARKAYPHLMTVPDATVDRLLADFATPPTNPKQLGSLVDTWYAQVGPKPAPKH